MAIYLLKVEYSVKIFPVPNGVICEFNQTFKEKKVNSSDFSNEFCQIFGEKIHSYTYLKKIQEDIIFLNISGRFT